MDRIGIPTAAILSATHAPYYFYAQLNVSLSLVCDYKSERIIEIL